MHGITFIYENGATKVTSSFANYDKEVELIPKEQEFINVLKSISDNDYKVVRRSKSYLSVLYKEVCFLRFNIGQRAMWFSLMINDSFYDKYINDIRFEKVKNTNQSFWKIDIENIDDLKKYADVISDVVNFM